MTIDRKDISHLERLSRLALSEGEAVTIAEQLQRIVTFVEKLQAVDTTDVPPTHSVSVGDDDGARDDVTIEGLPRAEILAQAPDATEEYFRVPRIIGEGSGDDTE